MALTGCKNILNFQRNHYHELTEEARAVFGYIPDEFVKYWTERFPRLLLHTWYAMQCVRSEPIFSKYYDNIYSFSQVSALVFSRNMKIRL